MFARVYYVQSIYLVGGGLIIEENIHVPMQELEGQRGEGAYFREDTVYQIWIINFIHFLDLVMNFFQCVWRN